MEGKYLEETLGDTSVDLCPATIISENEGIKWDFEFSETQNYFQIFKLYVFNVC